MPHCTPETCRPGQRCLHTSHAEENALGFCDGHIATAYVSRELAEPGTKLGFAIKDKIEPATVTALPFYKRAR